MCRFPEGGRPGKWLKTPAGWARACIWFDKLKELPRYGSLQEYLAILIWMRRQELDLSRTRLLADSGRDIKHEDLQKGFTAFLDNLFPFRTEALRDLVSEQKEVLDRWVNSGPIHFTPLVDHSVGAKTRKAQLVRGGGASED